MRALSLFLIMWPVSSFQPTQVRSSRRLVTKVAAVQPSEVSDKEWAMIVEAEKVSREKKYGPLAGLMVSTQDIEANQLRIWESIEGKRQAQKASNSRSARLISKSDISHVDLILFSEC